MSVHATPPHGATTTPCCDTFPGELADGDQLALNPTTITCGADRENRSMR